MNLLMVLSLAGLSNIHKGIKINPENNRELLRVQRNIPPPYQIIRNTSPQLYQTKRRNTVRNYHGI